MSIITAKELHCDGCGEWLRIDNAYLFNRVWRQLKKEGWTRFKGEHWCPNCTREMEGK